jgi:hypothetical protein
VLQHPRVRDRGDGIHLDVAIGPLGRQHPGEADQTGLGRAVVAHALGAEKACRRAGVEDSAVSPLAHHLPGRPGQGEGPFEMHVHQGVEQFGGDVFERGVPHDSCVVDEDVDATPRGGGDIDDRLATSCDVTLWLSATASPPSATISPATESADARSEPSPVTEPPMTATCPSNLSASVVLTM